MVDIPFVSENFQRSYRNTFPSQTSSGRDLHVSDVVIPIVDFTPTTSGTSLALELRNCINKNSNQNRITSATTTTVENGSGFFNVTCDLRGSSSTTTASFDIFTSSTTSLSIMNVLAGSGSNTRATFIVYLTSIDILRVITDSAADLSVMVTPLADINGNLINPNGFDPQ
jgi:hypothetical protein